MRCVNPEDKFPQWAADAAMSRYIGRQRKFAANPSDRKHHNRPARTWSYACTMALTKMRYRHDNPFRESRPPDEQVFRESRKRRQLRRKMDPIAAWADAEYWILERYYGRQSRESRPERFRAAVWMYIVGLRQIKIRRLSETLNRKTNENQRQD